MGRGAVPPASAHRDVHAVDVGEHEAAREGDLARGEIGLYVYREGVVGSGKAFEEPVFEHGPRAGTALFCGLPDEHQGPTPFVAPPGKLASGTHQIGHVDVMTTGVHDPYASTVRLRGGHRRLEFEGGLFGDGQRIEVAAQHDDRSGPVPENGDHAVAADTSGHLGPDGFELIPQTRGALLLEVRQLGLGMEGAIDRRQRHGRRGLIRVGRGNQCRADP